MSFIGRIDQRVLHEDFDDVLFQIWGVYQKSFFDPHALEHFFDSILLQLKSKVFLRFLLVVVNVIDVVAIGVHQYFILW